MVDEVVMRSHHFGRFPVRVIFALGHSPAFRDRLARALSCFVRHGRNQTGIQAS